MSAAPARPDRPGAVACDAHHVIPVEPHVQEVLDLIGIFAFALSGALLAVRKRFDVLGMAVLAEITALGGGTLRDLVIGAVPPAAFTKLADPLVPLLATAIVFFWHPAFDRLGSIRRAVLVFDAAGLGLFCVTGATKALTYGLGPVQAIGLGLCTATGGGILRDVLANDVPNVLHDKELYAIPALVGAGLAVGAFELDVYNAFTAVTAAVIAVALRLLARRFHWHAPGARGIPPD